MRLPRFTRLQLLVHLGSLLPLALLVYAYCTGSLTVNPIQAAEQRTGQYAIALLVLSLACTPINTLLRFPAVLRLRRPLGLYSFMYAAIHMLIFLALDYGFDWELIGQTVVEKRYLVAGMAAFVILVPLAITSLRWWMKRLGKSWKRLHRLVYLAAVLAVVHLAWAAKGDILTLQGDIWKPLAAGVATALLLALRVPRIRKSASAVVSRTRRLAVRPPVVRPGSALGYDRPRR